MRLPREWNEDEAITERMPLLDAWLDAQVDRRPLAGCTVLKLQHQLCNHVPQTRALLDLGVRPEDLYWIDIPYTARKPVQEAVRRMGVPEANFEPGGYKVLDAYAGYMRARVRRFIERIAHDPPEHLLVLDDGSYFLDALAHGPAVDLRRVSIVEQTTRGIIKIEDDAAVRATARRFPVINVARSSPKRRLEPPFIGIAVFQSLSRKLDERVRATRSDHALVLGFGDIGRQVAIFAERTLGFSRSHVHVWDPSSERMRAALDLGFTAWDRSSRTRFRLVLGCSGRGSFVVGDQHYLEDGAVLASASSGTVELSREQFIEFADRLPDDDVWIDRTGLDESDLHSDLLFHFHGHDAVFINAGFPVNFDGRVNCVPNHYIQPTATMMCAAAVQAVGEHRSGVLDLDADFCARLIADFRTLLGDEVRWLDGLES